MMDGGRTIVLADDDEDDRKLARQALKDGEVTWTLHTVNDGIELLDYLRRSPRPDLVLLDLNMPRMDGHEALHAIKRDPELRAIPVVIFSTSTAEDDVLQAYDAGSNSYIAKPRTYPALVDTLRSFSQYWTGTAELPPTA
jgi:two-component system response regulator